MRNISKDGMELVTVIGAKQASKLARYINSVTAFIRKGETERLHEFDGQSISGKTLITDEALLTSLAHAGALDFSTLYASPESQP
jgi:hypothetical protein